MLRDPKFRGFKMVQRYYLPLLPSFDSFAVPRWLHYLIFAYPIDGLRENLKEHADPTSVPLLL